MFHSNAGRSIVEQATKEKAHLVVVGARERSSIERVVLGSVSHYVLHNSQCPVAVAHRNKNKGSNWEKVLVYM